MRTLVQAPPGVAEQFQSEAEAITTSVLADIDPKQEGGNEEMALLVRCLIRFSVHQLGEGGDTNTDGSANLYGARALPEIRRYRKDMCDQQVLAAFLAGNIAITLGYYRLASVAAT